MGIVAVLATAIAPMVVRTVEIKAAEKSIIEVGMIQIAAQKYYSDHHAWPNDLLQLQTLGYLSPLWSLKNPWKNPYQAEFSLKTMAVKTQVPLSVVPILLARLPQASAVDDVVTSASGSSDKGSSMAPGIIVAWSGLIADVPSGWVLCDGNNGTPDLRDKFIVGARQDEGDKAKTNIMGVLNQTGGTIAHNHGGNSGGHQLTIAEMPAHHHGYNETPWLGSRYDGHSSPVMTGQVSAQTSDTGGNQPHTHPIMMDYHVPPYYALAFIMKL